MYKIKLYKAIDSNQEAKLYAEGHESMLSSLGYKKVTSTNLSWIINPHAYFIVLQDDFGNFLSGSRLHLSNKNFELPLQAAIRGLDDRTDQFLDKEMSENVSEICGMWSKKEASFMGISIIHVAKSCISICPKIKADKMYALTSPSIQKMSAICGLTVAEKFGDKGVFDYPTPDIRSLVMELNDPVKLQNAKPEIREAILSLRENPKQVRQEKIRNGIIKIQYDLTLD